MKKYYSLILALVLFILSSPAQADPAQAERGDLSALPNEMIVQILNCLNQKDRSILSLTCQNLWKIETELRAQRMKAKPAYVAVATFLGLNPDPLAANPEQVRVAYRKFAIKNHPARVTSEKVAAAQELFSQLNELYTEYLKELQESEDRP